jgi:hypothetical protein
MSHASDNPVHCAERENGCPAEILGDKHSKIRAQERGWFFSRKEERVYCPAHVPDWVAGWRERRNNTKT